MKVRKRVVELEARLNKTGVLPGIWWDIIEPNNNNHVRQNITDAEFKRDYEKWVPSPAYSQKNCVVDQLVGSWLPCDGSGDDEVTSVSASSVPNQTISGSNDEIKAQLKKPANSINDTVKLPDGVTSEHYKLPDNSPDFTGGYGMR